MNYTHIPPISCRRAERPLNAITASTLDNPEAHFEYELIFVIEGQARAQIGHKQYTLQPGSLLVISSLERHSFIAASYPYVRYIFSVSSGLLLSAIPDMKLISLFTQRPRDFCHVISLKGPSYQRVLGLFASMSDEFAQQQPFFAEQSAAFLLTLLIMLYRETPHAFPSHTTRPSTDAVISAQCCIHEHFDQKITLQEIADQNFISRHALSLAFHDLVGLPFKEYLVRFRLTEAKKRLLTTNRSVEQIAQEVGYPNVNNFIQIFKRYESLTPLQYRCRHIPGGYPYCNTIQKNSL